jgi:hemoglobin/transferrin/lactoferrin receptor protein
MQPSIISRIFRLLLKRSGLFLTLIVALVLSTATHAGLPTSQGDESIVLLVLDAKDNSPVIGVTFWSEKAAISEITNVKGRVRIDRFLGQNQIEIQALGYRKIILSYQELRALNDTLYIEPESFQLEHIVVSATRWRQNYASVSQAISIIEPEIIQRRQPQTMADALGLSGKVFIQKSQQGGGSPMIRGFATNRLLYSVDGIRMNTAIFRSGNIQNVINLDPFSMQNTEILFGPSSVMYGSDAIGGVMSFETLTPEFALDSLKNRFTPIASGKAVIRGTTANNERTGHLNLQLGWNKWAWLGSISRWQYDHLRQGSNGPDDYVKNYYVDDWQGTLDPLINGRVPDEIVQQQDPLLQIPSGYDQWNTLQKIRWQPTDGMDVRYTFQFSETSNYGRYDRHLRMRDGLPRYARWDYGPQGWNMHLFSINLSAGARGSVYDQLILKGARQNFWESRMSRNFGEVSTEQQEEQVLANSIHVDALKWLNERILLSYGVEWVQNKVNSEGVIQLHSAEENEPGIARYPDATWTSSAIFFHSDIQVNTATKLQAGLRYNTFQIDAQFGNPKRLDIVLFDQAQLRDRALVGSIGLISRPNNDWVLKLILGTAFRSPNVDDMGKIFDSEPGAVTVPNPNLKAEYAWNIDAGVVHRVINGLKLEVNAYWTHLENAMVRRDFELNGQTTMFYQGIISRIQAIQNAAYAQVYGMQWSLDAQLNNRWLLTTRMNLQKGEEELDDGSISPSRHVAPYFGESSLTYEYNSWSGSLIHRFQGTKSHSQMAVTEREKTELYALDAEGLAYAPSWGVWNLVGKYEFTDWGNILLKIENLTDQRYRPYSSGISAAGRSVQLGFSVRF